MVKVIVVLCLVGFISTAYALKCYTCITDKSNDNSCEMGKNMKTAECGKSISDTMKPACIKKTWKDKQTGVMNVTRKCILLDKDGNAEPECKNIPANYDSVFCEACTEDLCNKSNNFNVQVTLFVGSLALVIARYALN